MDEIRIPKAVGSLMEYWLLRVRPVVAAKLQAVYLGGGVALGDFAPKWSDLNTCVVLAAPLTPDEAQQLTALHGELEKLFVERRTSDWQSWRGIACTFLPRQAAGDAESSASCYSIREGSGRWCMRRALPAFERYVLSRRGILWMGEDVDFAPPRREELALETRAEMEMLERLGGGKRGALALACAVQNLARSLSFWRAKRLISKTEALEAASVEGRPFAAEFGFALALREQGIVGINAHNEVLRQNFDALASAGARELESLLRQNG